MSSAGPPTLQSAAPRPTRPAAPGPARRGGALVAGTWLIGLGLIFLIRDQAGLSWSEAWPLFIMLVGVGMLASSAAWGRRRWAGSWWLVWPIAWIGIGFVLLMSTTGRLATTPGDLVSTWWPFVPIGIGIWFLVASVWPGRAPVVETLHVPLTTGNAAVRLQFGAGHLQVGRSEPGTLVSGSFAGGVNVTERGADSISLEPDFEGAWMGWNRPLEWRVGLTGEVPLDLRVESGAARATLDLGELLVRRLDLRTGASETVVKLPRSAGASVVHVESGAASLIVEIPDGVAARIRSRMALGSTHVNEARFPRVGDGWASPDFETAANQVELDLQGGVGSIRID